MTDGPNLPRVYGDKEIGQILKRATELQDKEPTASSSSGLTLRELEEVAVEAGIDPRFLQRAASELETSAMDSGGWTRVVGDEMLLLRETTVPGELNEDGFERIVSVIQLSSRDHGQPSLLGRSLTWRAETPSKTRTVQVTVTSRDGQTHVRLEENLQQVAGGVFGGGFFGVGIGVGMGAGLPLAGYLGLGGSLLAAAFPLGALGLAFIGARQVYRSIVKKRRSVMADLFGKIVAEVHACVEGRALGGGEAPGQLPSPGQPPPE
jgi:hypothetical protein